MSNQALEVWCEGYGPIPSEFMFVGISAGRLGALQTHVPFTKDASGRLFQRCLKELGLSQSDEFSLHPMLSCYITNLVKGRCLTPEGLNRLPTYKEMLFWAPTFVREVEVVKPEAILCLSQQVYDFVRFRYPKLAKQLRHPRWYQAHGAISNQTAFQMMVRDWSEVLSKLKEVEGEARIAEAVANVKIDRRCDMCRRSLHQYCTLKVGLYVCCCGEILS